MRSSLFDTPLDQWAYQDIVAFLDIRQPENENIEYKADFPEKDSVLADTLVSMSNGDGGRRVPTQSAPRG
jgi:hypothetical protein